MTRICEVGQHFFKALYQYNALKVVLIGSRARGQPFVFVGPAPSFLLSLSACSRARNRGRSNRFLTIPALRTSTHHPWE